MPTWSDIQLWNSGSAIELCRKLNSRKQTIDQVATLENRQNSPYSEQLPMHCARQWVLPGAALRRGSQSRWKKFAAATKTVSVEHKSSGFTLLNRPCSSGMHDWRQRHSI